MSDRLQWLERKLREVEGDADAAREASSFNALSALHREARQIRNERDALIATVAAAPVVAATTTTLEESLEEARSLPIADRRALLDQIRQGLGLSSGDGQRLRVVSGG